MTTEQKTHYRKAFNSPYLSSADITEPTNLTISKVRLELDQTKKSKDVFNTAYFAEKELRPGEKLKPMILNATNSKTLRDLTGSAFIDDWCDVHVTVFVDPNVRFGRDTVEGLRISPKAPRKSLTPSDAKQWESAKNAYKRDGSLRNVLSRVDMSDEHQRQLMDECSEPDNAVS